MLPGIYPAQLSGAGCHRPWAAPIPDPLEHPDAGGGRRFSTDQDPSAIIINKEHLVPQVLPLFDSLAIPFLLVCGFLLSASFPWPRFSFSLGRGRCRSPFSLFHTIPTWRFFCREGSWPAPARAGPFPSHQAYSAPQPAARKKFPNFEKIITDAIAFPPPMTHNGVGFRVIRGRPPAKPPQDTGFCPQGGSQGDSIMAHRNGRQRPHQRVGEYPSAMPLGYGEPRNMIETGKEGTKASGCRAGYRCRPGFRQMPRCWLLLTGRIAEEGRDIVRYIIECLLVPDINLCYI